MERERLLKKPLKHSITICIIILFGAHFLLTGCSVDRATGSDALLTYPEEIRANFPVDLAFSKDKMFYIQKGGELKMVRSGSDETGTVAVFDVPDQETFIESGLLGIALSPNFDKNPYIYLFQSYQVNNKVFNRVIKINANRPEERPTIVINGIKGERNHNGGKIAFGPDGKLYIATGDARHKKLAQDQSALEGKILRINPDGTIPADNPFNNAVWSIGHRNIFGMTFDNEGRLFITENGATVNDEVNEIVKGGNYGWPMATGISEEFKKPLIVHRQVVVPTGIIFYKGDRYPKIKDKLVYGDYLKGTLRKIDLDITGASQTELNRIEEGIIAVAESPDGHIYVVTENGIRRMKIERNKKPVIVVE